MEEHAGRTYAIVFNEGSAVRAFEELDDANGYAYELNNRNTLSAVRESGRDIDDLTDDEYAEFEVMGGYEGGYAYAEYVTFPSKQDFMVETADGREVFDEREYNRYIDSCYITERSGEVDWGSILSAVRALEHSISIKDADDSGDWDAGDDESDD